MYITAGTLAEEYTEGGVITLAHDEMVFMLLLQAEVATEAGHVVNLYNVISSMWAQCHLESPLFCHLLLQLCHLPVQPLWVHLSVNCLILSFLLLRVRFK